MRKEMGDGRPLDLWFKHETGDLYMVDAYLDSMIVGSRRGIDFTLDFPFGKTMTPTILYQLYCNKIEKENNLDS